MLKAAQAYLQTQVTTTTQGQLLLMLYDGAMKFLRQAKERIAEKNYAAKGVLLSKAIDVISELDASLNVEKGGELATNLHKLYFYCNTRLLKANLYMNVDFIDEVIKILEGLRAAYAQIVNTQAANQPAPVVPAGPKPKTLIFPTSKPGTGGTATSTAEEAAPAAQTIYAPPVKTAPEPLAAPQPAAEAASAPAASPLPASLPIPNRAAGGAAAYRRMFEQT